MAATAAGKYYSTSTSTWFFYNEGKKHDLITVLRHVWISKATWRSSVFLTERHEARIVQMTKPKVNIPQPVSPLWFLSPTTNPTNVFSVILSFFFILKITHTLTYHLPHTPSKALNTSEFSAWHYLQRGEEKEKKKVQHQHCVCEQRAAFHFFFLPHLLSQPQNLISDIKTHIRHKGWVEVF